jgi:8-amino-7-oxononanoate synthase
LSGNNKEVERLELMLAFYHNAESALFFNSGYDANIGLLSCVARKNDTYIYDEYCHNSLIMGMKLSGCKMVSFKHNDSNDLEEKLKESRGLVYMVYESLYSMDGDTPPLHEFTQLSIKYGAYQIIDEAHTTGLWGDHGEGMVAKEKLTEHFFARTYTCSKSVGGLGGFVLGNKYLKSFLINYSSTFTYSAGSPLHTIIFNLNALHKIFNTPLLRTRLFELSAYFILKMKKIGFNYPDNVKGPVLPIQITGELPCRQLGLELQMQGFDARPIIFPTVPRGHERLRICLHTFNTYEEIDMFCEIVDLFINNSKFNNIGLHDTKLINQATY